jgi:hypothetical protein
VQLHYKDTFICVYLQTRRRHCRAQSRRAAFQLRLLHVAAVHADGPNVIVVLSHILMCVHWGHAAASIGLDIALREGIRRIIFMHHDPAAGDERIYNVEQQTRRYYERMVKHMREAGEPVVDVEWSFAIEGMEIEV